MRKHTQRVGLASWVPSVGLALFAAALSLQASPARAQSFTLPPAEKVPTFLGVDLPLRPGERLLPLGKGGCSLVVFAPKPEHYEAHRKLWSPWEWTGACRFGLIHGSGQFYFPNSGGARVEIWAIYGTQYYPAPYQDTFGNRHHWSYSGAAFSDQNTKKMYLSGAGDSENLDRFEKNPGNVFGVGLDTFDMVGNAKTVFIQSNDVSYVCETNNEDVYKPFSREVKSACSKKKAGQFVVLRKEGLSIFGFSNPIVWLKACPLKRDTGQADCRALMRNAIGKHYAELETIIAGSPAARPAMTQEIFNRYAPLEAAVEARLKEQVAPGGAR